MNKHTYWKSPALEQREDEETSWQKLCRDLDRAIDLREKLSNARVLRAAA